MPFELLCPRFLLNSLDMIFKEIVFFGRTVISMFNSPLLFKTKITILLSFYLLNIVSMPLNLYRMQYLKQAKLYVCVCVSDVLTYLFWLWFCRHWLQFNFILLLWLLGFFGRRGLQLNSRLCFLLGLFNSFRLL